MHEGKIVTFEGGGGWLLMHTTMTPQSGKALQYSVRLRFGLSRYVCGLIHNIISNASIICELLTFYKLALKPNCLG